jgi:DNA-directed RNA polymerase subunit M/transcription elongation factor TFIIS
MTTPQPTPRDTEQARFLLEYAPKCSECGALTVRVADFAKCLNCGHERNWYVALQDRLAAALANERRFGRDARDMEQTR